MARRPRSPVSLAVSPAVSRAVSLAGALAALGWGPAAAAQSLELQITNPQVTEGQVRAALGPELESSLKVDSQQEFLQRMAQATALSARGMGVDYASTPQRFVIGGSVGSGISGEGAGLGWGSGVLPSGGFAFQGAAMVGLNVGMLARSEGFARRVMLYGHGMGAAGTRGAFSTTTANFGGHVQVGLVGPVGEDGPARWGGVQATVGLERNLYRLQLSQGVPLEADGLSWEADGTYTVDAASLGIPLELSTNMKLGPVSVFGGGALDIEPATAASSEIALEGPIEGRVNGQRGEIGLARLVFSESGTGSAVAPRGFFGAQINVKALRVYGQLNLAGERGFGAHAGLRVAM